VTAPRQDRGLGFSFPIFVPLVIQPVLLVGMVMYRAQGWVYLLHAVYMGIVGFFLWKALSRAQLARAQATAPALTTGTWRFQWLFFFVVLPLLFWLFFGLLPLLRYRG
jgi:hypothetical protein